MAPVQEEDLPEQSHVAEYIATPPRPLWRNWDFLLLVSGQAVSSVGSQISLIAFPLLILALTHSPAQAGLMTAVRGIPIVLFCLPAGALVDRWNRKHLMIFCDSGRALALGSIPIALVLGHLTYLQLYAVSLVEGTLYIFFTLAESACLPRVVTREQLPAAVAQNEVLYSIASVIGPALGAILYGLGNLIPFLSDGISYLISAVALFFIKAEFQGEREVTARRWWVEVGEGVVWLWHTPLLRFIAVLTFGLITPCSGYVLILILLAQQMHASSLVTGMVFAGGGAGSIIGALLVVPLQKRFSFGQLIISSSWVWALTWLFFAIAPNPIVLSILNGMSFVIVPIYTLTQYSYRLALIPDRLQGRVNSVFRLIALGGQPIGLVLTGLLLQFIGPVPTVVILFVPQLVLVIAATLNKHVRHARPVGEIVG
ncbi:MAG: MFS transporter [Ktedonobacteraceae bacterium]